jgi:hypothetical protein
MDYSMNQVTKDRYNSVEQIGDEDLKFIFGGYFFLIHF